MNNKTIIYIAGEGHSGSTLLDIILGSQKNSFSTGELINLFEKGILNHEFCSCGEIVPKCIVWKEIIEVWEDKRKLDLNTYILIRNFLVSNRKIFKAHRLLKKPSQNVKDFLEDTRILYEIIFDRTSSDCIIDSSKAVGFIPILKYLDFDVKIIHLTRRFGDVLNSFKKHKEKDLKAGVEHEKKPEKTIYVLRSWLLKNLLAKLYSKGINYQKVKYEDYISNLEDTILQIADYNQEFHKLIKNRGPFVSKHLVAGNSMRMKDEIYVAQKPMGTSYHRLNKRDKVIARCVDAFY